jgi:hypothetical protein
MISLLVLVIDGGFCLAFETAWREVAIQRNTVLQGLTSTLNNALRLGGKTALLRLNTRSKKLASSDGNQNLEAILSPSTCFLSSR